jgi:hypothetical protein
VLIFQLQPLLTPDRKGLAEGSLTQLEENGVSINEVSQPSSGVVAYSGLSPEGPIQGRVIADRGWVFLIVGEGPATELLRRLLDKVITSFEGDTSTDRGSPSNT